MDNKTTIQELKLRVKKYCEDRDWDKYHNAKDLSIGITTEASELLEYFRFKSEQEVNDIVKSKRNEISEEMTDVFFFLLRIAQKYEIDLSEAFDRKMKKNALKYPIEKAYMILASPWYASQTRVVNLRKSEPFIFTEELFVEMIRKESTAFKNEHTKGRFKKAAQEDNLVLIEEHVVQLKCNGYEVKNPFEKKVKTVEMPLYLSVAPQVVLEAFTSSVKNVFPKIDIVFGTFPLAYFFAARELYSKFDDALLVDVSGEVTDIAFVLNGVLLEITSFPLGKNTIFRRLSSSLHRPAEEIISLLSTFFNGKTNKEMSIKIEKAFSEVADSTINLPLQFPWASKAKIKLVIMFSEVFL